MRCVCVWEGGGCVWVYYIVLTNIVGKINCITNKKETQSFQDILLDIIIFLHCFSFSANALFYFIRKVFAFSTMTMAGNFFASMSIYKSNRMSISNLIYCCNFLHIYYNSLDIIAILQFVKLSKCLFYSKMVYIVYIILIVYVMPWTCRPGSHSGLHQSHNAFT